MDWVRRSFALRARSRGFHLVTDEVLEALPELARFEVGILHLLIQHTSASLTINENADPSVRDDMESHFDRAVPENAPYYRHVSEGPDDMPAHIKSSLLGAAVILPVGGGRLELGTWQGIYLCEHRDNARSRRVVATIWGEVRGKK